MRSYELGNRKAKHEIIERAAKTLGIKPGVGSMTTGITFSNFLRDWSKMNRKLDAKKLARKEHEDKNQSHNPSY